MKAKLQKKYDLYIGGEWVAAGDQELIAVHSPIDGKELAHIAEATEGTSAGTDGDRGSDRCQ